MTTSNNINDIVVFHTDHFVNQTVTQFFSKSNQLKLEKNKNYEDYKENIFASYGILRGNDLIYKKFRNFIYIDHGYISSSRRKFEQDKTTTIIGLDGYFRFVKNDFYFNKSFKNNDQSRFLKLKINLKDLNKFGEYILVSEPSDHTLKFLNIPNWTNETVEEIKKFTDRRIIIHNKFSKIPFDEIIKKAYCFVSCQSTAAFKAIAEGIPSFFTHDTFKEYGNIQHIEKRQLNYDLLYIAANSQWKLKELFSDEFKVFLSKIIDQ